MFDLFANKRLVPVLVWLGVVAGAAYVFVFEPGKSGFFPICPFRALTGFTCPGCGSTRALHELLHGHVLEAFMLNPLLLLGLPFVLFLFIRQSAFIMRGTTPRRTAVPPSAVYALLFIILSFWIVRNTPIYPFVS